MTIEKEIINLSEVYSRYSEVFDTLENSVYDVQTDESERSLLEYKNELNNFDIKLRLGLAVREITLNNEYVREKSGALKSCHLMFYKLADLWFSYETFFKLVKFTSNRDIAKNKIVWLDQSTNQQFKNNAFLTSSLEIVNNEFVRDFNTDRKREALKGYIHYCSNEAKGKQKTRLNSIYENITIEAELQPLSHTEILSLTYAIRNNFVHNGEATIIPSSFSYVLKSKCLNILYKYLVIITLSSATKVTQVKIGEE